MHLIAFDTLIHTYFFELKSVSRSQMLLDLSHSGGCLILKAHFIKAGLNKLQLREFFIFRLTARKQNYHILTYL